MFLAFLIANEAWPFLIPVALVVPGAILFNRYPFVAVMIWLLVFPFFAREPSAAGRYIYWILHRAMIPTALGIAILSDWLRVKKREPVRLGRAELAMVIFLGLALVNIFLFSRDSQQMVYNFYDRVFVPFCMYWLVRLTTPGEKDLKRLLWVASFTVVAQSTIGLLTWFAPQVLPPQWLGPLEGERTVGTLGNPAAYTTTLIFLSLLLFQHAMHCRSGRVRAVLLLVFSSAFFCVFLSFSRGSWLGGSMVLVGLMLMYPKVVVRLTIIVTLLVYILSSSVLADQVAWAWERLTGEEGTRTAEGRMITNNASIQMIQTKPLFGWGYGNYDRYDRQFQTRVGNVAVTSDETSHNTYLTVMAELGLIAFLLYIFPLGWWLMLSIKAWRRLPRDGFWGWPLLAMLWLSLMHNFIVSNFMDMIRFHLWGTTLWWMALGLAANMVYPYLKPGDIGAPSWA